MKNFYTIAMCLLLAFCSATANAQITLGKVLIEYYADNVYTPIQDAEVDGSGYVQMRFSLPEIQGLDTSVENIDYVFGLKLTGSDGSEQTGEAQAYSKYTASCGHWAFKVDWSTNYTIEVTSVDIKYDNVIETSFEDLVGQSATFSTIAEPTLDYAATTECTNGSEALITFTKLNSVRYNNSSSKSVLGKIKESPSVTFTQNTDVWPEHINQFAIKLSSTLNPGTYTLVFEEDVLIFNGYKHNAAGLEVALTVADPTGVDKIEGEKSYVRYTLGGVRTSNAKGIVIENGKKVIIK